ncbi:MAG: hydrolase CocE/NonD family protein [Acidobacteria bacterium]|nr:hydrolase CocE/NonD family protein [Acidobacteriota bacterium]
MRRTLLLSFALATAGALALSGQTPGPGDLVHEPRVAVPMRDGVTLIADVWRPSREGRFPTLVYRTPYGRGRDLTEDSIFRKALARGYAVVSQDVRGRYDSGGEFNPYFQERHDGYDTIEWAARQPWSTGEIGTFGLSYPGAVQWLAAIEQPPHLKAMAPAMTFSTPRNFIYSGGLFDGSWIAWAWFNISPDARVRKNLEGPRTRKEAATAWDATRDRMQRTLPLSAMAELRDTAPWYYQWLSHPPEDAWWDAIDLRDKYDRVTAAVLNLSGWHDETYGPEGATTNFTGLIAARRADADPRTRLVMGPWVHGIPGPEDTKAGDRDFGPTSVIDYDELVLRWMDRYVRGIDNGVEGEPRVRAFVMGANRWREASAWPLPGTETQTLYLASAAREGQPGTLAPTPPAQPGGRSAFVSNPADPVTDPHEANTGPHDYAALAHRPDVLVWETAPLDRDLEAVGHITATIHLSCDAPDTDLWVKLYDVGPDGRALNLMSPGLDVLRASAREPGTRQLLDPGRVYALELRNLITGNAFTRGHRVRVLLSATFFPHFSRNLQTGLRETAESGETRRATITIHHDAEHPSRIVLPVMGQRP